MQASSAGFELGWVHVDQRFFCVVDMHLVFVRLSRLSSPHCAAYVHVHDGRSEEFSVSSIQSFSVKMTPVLSLSLCGKLASQQILHCNISG